MQFKRKISSGLKWIASRRDARGGVLLYHRIDEPDLDPFNLCVSPENFEKQLAVIAESGKALSLHEFMERKNRDQLDRGSVCLTFDDGYLDVLTNALPLLEKYEIPATLFVTTGNLGKAFWWDRLASLVYPEGALPSTLFLEPAQSPAITIKGLSRKAIYKLLYPILRSSSATGREAIFSSLAKQLPDENRIEPQRCASADEIGKVASHSLLSIGAHTVTHSRLSSLDYPAQLREMSDSIDTLSAITGSKIDTFSYPFGLEGRDFDKLTLKAAKEAGIRYGFAADLNAVTPHTDDLAVPRLWVHNKAENAVRLPLQLWTGTSFRPPVSLAS
ncbi:MAG: polysaccharide deacetylase family protein [Verrucomicrobiales bacterium]|nr:polysaccharide deacetylase family protein [Verrucomicrobiales bacterium]